jgi:hypothetical protein
VSYVLAGFIGVLIGLAYVGWEFYQASKRDDPDEP